MAVLALVTAGAVAIERVIEVFWTVIGLTLGTSWPHAPFANRVQKLVSTMDVTLQSYVRRADEVVNRVGKARDLIAEEAAAADAQLKSIKELVQELGSVGSDNVRAKAVADAASRSILYLEAVYPELERAGTATNRIVDGVGEALASFVDNPARRLISIYAGAALGLLLAALFGLDALFAVLGPTPFSNAPPRLGAIYENLPGLGVALTGLAMGLGANPTHEIIRVLQEIKKGRKAETARR